jgi:solute carrier family 25 citrate transporter 1
MSTAPKKQKKGWRSFVAGGLGGAAEILATMPLDVAKTTMQLNPKMYSSPVHAIRSIYQSGGVRALYYGMPAFLSQTSLKAAIRFYTFETTQTAIVKTFQLDATQASSPLLTFFCGLIAGSMEAVIWTTPTERLKVLRQKEVHSANPRYTSLGGAIRLIYQEQGIGGFYKGIVPTATRQATSVAVRFMLLNPVKKVLKSMGLTNPSAVTFLAGGICGALSVTTNNPIDVVKSHMQSQDKHNAKYSGSIDCFKTILREEGVQGLFAGLPARAIRVFCGQAVTFLVYERIVGLLQKI